MTQGQLEPVQNRPENNWTHFIMQTEIGNLWKRWRQHGFPPLDEQLQSQRVQHFTLRFIRHTHYLATFFSCDYKNAAHNSLLGSTQVLDIFTHRPRTLNNLSNPIELNIMGLNWPWHRSWSRVSSQLPGTERTQRLLPLFTFWCPLNCSLFILHLVLTAPPPSPLLVLFFSCFYPVL